MASYKTPGVYVEEISTLPPSVAEVATAVPAFIGYTNTRQTEEVTEVFLAKVAGTNVFTLAEKPVSTLDIDDPNITVTLDPANKTITLGPVTEDKEFSVTYSYNKIKPVRINTLLEFKNLFGRTKPADIKVACDYDDDSKALEIQKIDIKESSRRYLMYYALQLFYSNGGGACYIVSVGSYNEVGASISYSDLKEGLDAISKVDEPTLLVFTDAVNLPNKTDCFQLYQDALAQCNKLGDRFGIFDVLPGDNNAFQFRNNIGNNFLKYGAAYMPYLKTTIPYYWLEDQVDVEIPPYFAIQYPDANGIEISYMGAADPPKFRIAAKGGEIDFKVENQDLTIEGVGGSGKPAKDIIRAWEEWKKTADDNAKKFDITPVGDGEHLVGKLNKENLASNEKEIIDAGDGLKITYSPAQGETSTPSITINETSNRPAFSITGGVLAISGVGASPNAKTGAEVEAVWNDWKSKNDHQGFEIKVIGTSSPRGSSKITSNAEKNIDRKSTFKLNALQAKNTNLYQAIKLAIGNHRLTLPPGPAIAGVYAQVDRDRGVWKAPANVSLSAVIGPDFVINNDLQNDLNVDATSGKSINAIRSFTGKGTLVWGARTLAGNDNEWRYISVRRLFNLVEESIQKSTGFAVFEPNDTATWLKVKAMIDSYLYGLWQQGALAGPAPEQAYFVNVGLGKSMTPQDILEGRMIIEIGLAAVRPAEFIILKFSHKMQEA